MSISYQTGNDIDFDKFVELYRASTLGERRPIDDTACMASMLAHANLVVTAWNDGDLVGIARSLTDFTYVAYLSDLAVHRAFQRRGIGRELVRRTHARLGPRASLVLLAAPAAVDYYPRLGFRRHPQAWILDPGHPLQDPH